MSDTVSLKILVDTVKGIAGLKKMGDSLVGIGKQSIGADKAISRLKKELEGAEKELQVAARKTDTTAKEMRELSKKTKSAADRLKFLASGSQKASKALKKVDKEADKTSKSMEGLGKAFKVLGGVIATIAVFDKLKESISMASDMTEIQTKMNVVFGKMSGDANKWAENYSDSMGFSVMKTKESMGDIQNLFTGFGMAREESFGLSKEIIGLANDLDSFNNLSSRGIDVQKTMISALMGETEAAKTLGTSILETNLNTAAAALGLGKYSSKMAESTKIQIRLKAIQMQSKDATGDVSRNLETEVGKRRRLNSEIMNMKVSLGDKLMPIQMAALDLGLDIIKMIKEHSDTLNKLYDATSHLVTETFDFVKSLKDLYESSILIKGTIYTLIGTYTSYKAITLALWGVEKAKTAWELATLIPTAIGVHSLTIIGIGLKVKEKVATLGLMAAVKTMAAVTKIQIIAQGALNFVMSLNPIGALVIGFMALIGVGLLIHKNWDAIKNKTLEFWEVLRESPIGFIVDAFETLGGAIVAVFDFFKGFYDLWKKFNGEKDLEINFKENITRTVTNDTEREPLRSNEWDNLSKLNNKNKNLLEQNDLGLFPIFNNKNNDLLVSNELESSSKSDDTKIDGSHRTGISYIPKDGYLAELHKGERVLTSNENKKYGSQSESKTNIITITIEKLFDNLTIQKSEEKDLNEITDMVAERFVSKLNLAMANLG